MKYTDVESSNIAQIGHEDDELHVRFKDRTLKRSGETRPGELYSFLGVPKSVYEDFMEAPSKGRFFREYIQGRYPGSKQ